MPNYNPLLGLKKLKKDEPSILDRLGLSMFNDPKKAALGVVAGLAMHQYSKSGMPGAEHVETAVNKALNNLKRRNVAIPIKDKTLRVGKMGRSGYRDGEVYGASITIPVNKPKKINRNISFGDDFEEMDRMNMEQYSPDFQVRYHEYLTTGVFK